MWGIDYFLKPQTCHTNLSPSDVWENFEANVVQEEHLQASNETEWQYDNFVFGKRTDCHSFYMCSHNKSRTSNSLFLSSVKMLVTVTHDHADGSLIEYQFIRMPISHLLLCLAAISWIFCFIAWGNFLSSTQNSIISIIIPTVITIVMTKIYLYPPECNLLKKVLFQKIIK